MTVKVFSMGTIFRKSPPLGRHVFTWPTLSWLLRQEEHWAVVAGTKICLLSLNVIGRMFAYSSPENWLPIANAFSCLLIGDESREFRKHSILRARSIIKRFLCQIGYFETLWIHRCNTNVRYLFLLCSVMRPVNQEDADVAVLHLSFVNSHVFHPLQILFALCSICLCGNGCTFLHIYKSWGKAVTQI